MTTDFASLKHNSTVFPFMLAATTGGKKLGVVVSMEIRQRPNLPFFLPIVSHFFSLWFAVFDNLTLTLTISHRLKNSQKSFKKKKKKKKSLASFNVAGHI